VWGIIKKDMIYYLFYFVVGVVFPLFGIWQDGLDRGGVVFMGMCLAMTVLFSMFLNELMEEKSRGYEFLRSLPLTPSWIVGAKFILPAVFAGGYMAIAGAVLWLNEASSAFRITGFLYLLAMALLCLLLVGMFFLALYRLGFTRLYRSTVLTVSFLIMLGPVLALLLLGDMLAAWQDVDWQRLTTVPVLVSTALIGLSGYAMLYRAAGRALRRREE